jgi:CIC family chloride channel protein
VIRSVVPRIRSAARQFLLPTLVVTGALCGVAAALFHRFVEAARLMLIGGALQQHGVVRSVAVVATPMIVFTLIAFAIRRFAPRAVGANLARVRMAYNADPKLLGKRSVLATFIATPLSLGAGAPLGPEGPIVVVSSGIAILIGRALALPRKLIRGMIPVGVAAGIAAIFNTPITGVVFALEEVFGTADRGLLGGVLVGAVAAAVTERALLGGEALLAAPSSSWSDPRELFGFALIGIVAGLVSGLAIGAMHRLKKLWTKAMPSLVVRAAMAGAIVGAIGLVAPETLSVGYESVSLWLHGGGSASSAGIAFGLKTLVFVAAISGGVLGGTFAPSLFIGAALGAALGHGANLLFPSAHIDPRAYAIVGMGSFFAGLLRSPIAAVLIVIELTRDYELVVPLMLAVTIGVAISHRLSPLSIVEQQMIDEGWIEAPESGDPLASLVVSSLMSANVIAFRTNDTLAAARASSMKRHHIYPVVDDGGVFAGIVTADALAGEGFIGDVIEQPKLVALATERTLDLIERMQIAGVDRCVVIDGRVTRRVAGFVSPSDILRARMSALRDEQV